MKFDPFFPLNRIKHFYIKFYCTIPGAKMDKIWHEAAKTIYRMILAMKCGRERIVLRHERSKFRANAKSFLRPHPSTKLIGILAVRDTDHFLVLSTRCCRRISPHSPRIHWQYRGVRLFKWAPSCLKELANFRLLVTPDLQSQKLSRRRSKQRI